MIKIPDVPEKERPIGERYRVLSKAWREADKLARYYKDNRKSVFDRMVMEILRTEGSMAMNKAQTLVSASEAWEKWRKDMGEAVDKAADLKEELIALKLDADDLTRNQIQNATERKYSRYS